MSLLSDFERKKLRMTISRIDQGKVMNVREVCME